LKFVAPFVGLSVSEYFRNFGSDVLLILDNVNSFGSVCGELLSETRSRLSYLNQGISQIMDRIAVLREGRGSGYVSDLFVVIM
jgi:F0F1-type ATP synthase beta subunit